VIVAVMLVRKVETVEVYAALLFVPDFLALVVWGLRGGLAAGAAAALAYGAMRQPAIERVGSGPFVNLIVGRSIGYLAFGAIGGFAAQQLEGSLEKLDVYDVIDDETGLNNARFFIQDTDLEMASTGSPAGPGPPPSATSGANSRRPSGRWTAPSTPATASTIVSPSSAPKRAPRE
jgi:hypothetical protein